MKKYMSPTGRKGRDWEKLLKEQENNRRWLDSRLYDLDYPGLYLGDEMNTFHFHWEDSVRKGLISDTWRIAFLNLQATRETFSVPALIMFYELLHEYEPSWVVERSLYPPSENDQRIMKEDGIRPFAVESKMPLEAFDVICLSMNTTISAVAVPWLLLAGGIPMNAAERCEEDPILIFGGAAVVNPGPYARFMDIIFFGEGEEVLPELMRMLEERKSQGVSRDEMLLEAACRWDCLYVSRFYEERFDARGKLAGTFPLNPRVPERVRFCRVKDIDNTFIPKRPFLNFCTYAGFTSHFEISKGCEGKCSFCMAGFTTLPFRPRSSEIILEATEKIIYETGNITVSPVSYNLVSHPEINRIVRDLGGIVGNQVKLGSMRVDGFRSNPELCCFISVQKFGRVAFGVEGSSQRLRDYVSKNLTEEQILDAMHEACRYGIRVVKFMMICGLPSETEADLDEFYELAVKIRDIFREETGPGAVMPRLVITWTPLVCSPHTPLQWAKCQENLMPAYETFTEKIKELGFSTFTPEYDAEMRLTQLFVRGDSRISDLLVYLAKEGYLRHKDLYGEEVYEKAVRFLKDNGLPPVEEWLREYSLEEHLPWDVVQGPSSREYLYRRYMAMYQKKPASVPICSEKCSGCGACSIEQRKVLEKMPEERLKDRKVELGGLARKNPVRPVRHMLLEFEPDKLHSVVIPSYWDCEIRRALFHAGISFDPDSIQCFGSDEFADHSAAGLNVTNISLGQRYEPDMLKKCLEEYGLNFRVRSVKEIESPVRVNTVTYRMELPEGTDTVKLSGNLQNRLSESKWMYISNPDMVRSPYRDIKPGVQSLEVEDNYLLITMGPEFPDPRAVYGYLLGITAGQAKHHMLERIGYTIVAPD